VEDTLGAIGFVLVLAAVPAPIVLWPLIQRRVPERLGLRSRFAGLVAFFGYCLLWAAPSAMNENRALAYPLELGRDFALWVAALAPIAIWVWAQRWLIRRFGSRGWWLTFALSLTVPFYLGYLFWILLGIGRTSV
jgi:hypothetical protein